MHAHTPMPGHQDPVGLQSRAGQEVVTMTIMYHRDGRSCFDAWSCSDEKHTSIPPACGASSDAQIPGAGGAVACELPKGHPGPHLHVATGCEY